MSSGELITGKNALSALRDELPSFMEGETPDESVGEHALLPRLQIVFGTSDAKFTSVFGVGDVILPDTMTLIAKAGDPIIFTPVFIYNQFECRNPRQAQDLPSLRYVTLDKNSDIAKKAYNRVEEVCPNNDGGFDSQTKEPRKMRYQMSLNTIWYLHEFEQLVALSFYRMEYQAGQRLSTLVQQRKKKMYGCIFEARTSVRAFKGNKWPGFDFANPTGVSPWIGREELFIELRTLAEEQREKYVQILEAGAGGGDVPEHGTSVVDNPDVAKQFE